MKIVIGGAGKVGMAIARQMCREGHDITLIDQRQDRLENAVGSLDVIGCCGNCSAVDILAEADAGGADVFLAATGVLLKEAMDLTFSLHPDYVTAEEISRVLQFPAAVRIESFPDCEQEIVSFRIEDGCRLSGLPLKQLSSRFGQKVLVCSIERSGSFRIPDGDTVLNTGDSNLLAKIIWVSEGRRRECR